MEIGKTLAAHIHEGRLCRDPSARRGYEDDPVPLRCGGTVRRPRREPPQPLLGEALHKGPEARQHAGAQLILRTRDRYVEAGGEGPFNHCGVQGRVVQTERTCNEEDDVRGGLALRYQLRRPR